MGLKQQQEQLISTVHSLKNFGLIDGYPSCSMFTISMIRKWTSCKNSLVMSRSTTKMRVCLFQLSQMRWDPIGQLPCNTNSIMCPY